MRRVEEIENGYSCCGILDDLISIERSYLAPHDLVLRLQVGLYLDALSAD